MNFQFLIIIIVIGIFVAIVSLIKENKFQSKVSYRKKQSVMNQSEAAFFYELKKQLPEGFYIFPKMRIADILDVPNGHDYYRMRNQILPKHIDFLICGKNFTPVVAIEVNGKSHIRQDRIERDERVKRIFEDAKIPLEFVNVGSSFTDSISNIKSLL